MSVGGERNKRLNGMSLCMLLSRQDVLRSQDLGVGRSSGTLGIFPRTAARLRPARTDSDARHARLTDMPRDGCVPRASRPDHSHTVRPPATGTANPRCEE